MENAVAVRSTRDVQLSGDIDDVPHLLLVCIMADQNDLEAALPRPQGGEDGLVAFQMFHNQTLV